MHTCISVNVQGNNLSELYLNTSNPQNYDTTYLCVFNLSVSINTKLLNEPKGVRYNNSDLMGRRGGFAVGTQEQEVIVDRQILAKRTKFSPS